MRSLLYAVSRRYPICSTHRLRRAIRPTIASAQYNIQSKIYTAVLRMNKCHENLARRMPEIRQRLADYRPSRGCIESAPYSRSMRSMSNANSAVLKKKKKSLRPDLGRDNSAKCAAEFVRGFNVIVITFLSDLTHQGFSPVTEERMNSPPLFLFVSLLLRFLIKVGQAASTCNILSVMINKRQITNTLLLVEIIGYFSVHSTAFQDKLRARK